MSSQGSESSPVRQGSGSCPEPGFLDQYYMLRAISYGMFGQLHLALHRFTGAQVAVKVLKMVVQNIPVLSEPDILKRLEHPNIVRLFQVLKTGETMYVVMEHAAGEQLLERIPHGGMQQEEALAVFRQVVCGMAYCHDQGVVHRDLKPENIVVNSRGQVKIINFGFGARFRDGQTLNNFWGTREYLAPEIVLRQPYEGPPADIWSLGVLLYFMLTGRRPFRGSTAQEMLQGVILARYHVPSSVPGNAQKLIHQILILNPKKRPTSKQILQHPWLRQGEPCAPDPSSQALPTRPESEVLITLFKMGFDPYETWVSLTKRKFDTVMATYLLLKYPQGQGAGGDFQGRPVPSEEAQQPRHRAIRGGTLLALPLCCRSAGAPALYTFSQSDSGLPTPDTSKHFSGRSGTDSSSSPSSQDTAQGRGHTNSWKPVRRRTTACVPALCGSVPRVSNMAQQPQRRCLPRP